MEEPEITPEDMLRFESKVYKCSSFKNGMCYLFNHRSMICNIHQCILQGAFETEMMKLERKSW